MQVEFTNQFQKDFAKRIAGTALDAEFEALLAHLMAGGALPVKYRDHPLKGDRLGRRDCHLRPDMVVLYARGSTVLKLYRIGSHSELFG